MCVRDKEKAFPLNTQKLEPGQDRDAARASRRQNQFLICFWKELSDWFFYYLCRKSNVNLQQRSSQFLSISQQSTRSGFTSTICKFLQFCFSWTFSTGPDLLQDKLPHCTGSNVCQFLSTICWRRVPSPGVQDLSPSHLLSVNLPPELHPETTLWSGGDWWWAEEQRLVLWKALRGAMETLHTQSSERPDIESRASEQWTAGYASDAKQGFRKCTQRARWVAIRNK